MEAFPQEVLNEVSAWTDDIAGQVQDRIRYLAQSLQSSPQSAAAMYQTKENINQAAAAVLDGALVRYEGDDAGRAALEAAKTRFLDRANEMRQAAGSLGDGEVGDPNQILGQKAGKGDARKQYVAALAHGAGTVGVDTPGCNEMDLAVEALDTIFNDVKVEGVARHELAHAFGEAINQNPRWAQPLHNEIHLSGQSATGLVQTRIAHSVISPAPVFFPSYENKGVNSHESTESVHAVNLALTQLTDSQGKTLFTGARHGVISAFGLTGKSAAAMSDKELQHLVKTLLPKDSWACDAQGNPDLAATTRAARQEAGRLSRLKRWVSGAPGLMDKMRAVANTNRAREIVAMMVATDLKLADAAIRGETVTLDLLSVSLVTPDSFRRGEDDNEHLMLADQAAAWKSLTGVQTIDIPDQSDGGVPISVKVDVRPIPVNYGVNGGALTYGRLPAVSGWGPSNALNGPSLRDLFGDDLSNIAHSREGVLGNRVAVLEERNRHDIERARTALRDHPVVPSTHSRLVRAFDAAEDGAKNTAKLIYAQCRAELAARSDWPSGYRAPLKFEELTTEATREGGNPDALKALQAFEQHLHSIGFSEILEFIEGLNALRHDAGPDCLTRAQALYAKFVAPPADGALFGAPDANSTPLKLSDADIEKVRQQLDDAVETAAFVRGNEEERLRLENALEAAESVANDQGTPLGAVLELQRQIARIHQDHAYRVAGNEPYKMPTRLAVLADMLGVKVAFNCKSGKDRTGELDTEIKHFKLQMQMTGKVPHYERERSGEEVRHFYEVFTNSGNFEMQRLNTGYAGYKLKGVDALYRQFGAADEKDPLTRNFHGLSDRTAS